MLSLLLLVLLPVALQGQEFPPNLCCMPVEYEGFIGEAGVEGIVGNFPIYYTTLYRFSYSQNFEAVYWQFLGGDPIYNRREVLIDFTDPAQPVSYTTYEDSSCVQEIQLERMTPGCEQSIENRVLAYYKGIIPNTFDAFSSYDQTDPDYLRSYVWDMNCDVHLVTSIYSGPANVFGSYTEVFMNMTMGITDSSVFTPPANCPPATNDPSQVDLMMESMKRSMGIVPIRV